MTATLDGLTLGVIERYYDGVPRSSARTEEVGPFTLFVAERGWPFYGRPHLGLTGEVTVADVDRLRRRQRALGVVESIEWVGDLAPSLAAAAAAAGLTVSTHPLMVLDPQRLAPAAPPPGAVVRLLAADDPEFARAHAVAHVAFARPGTSTGVEGPVERDLAAGLANAQHDAFRRSRTRDGLTRTVVATSENGPLCVGSHQPVGDVTEIVGVATLPSARRRGLAATVTSALVADALARGVRTVFLSAGDDDVARVYARLGFRRIGTACIAEPAEDDT